MQLHQVEMLKQLITVFNDSDISYFAIGGTALGAVRHQGFIPWDDDIDIAMPRSDYEKFLTLQHKLPENLFIQHFRTENEYNLHFAKVRDSNTRFIEKNRKNLNTHHGIFIDIFPWDNICNVKKDKSKIKTAYNKFRRTLWTKQKRTSTKDLIKTYFYRFIYNVKSSSQAYSELDFIQQQHNKEQTKYFGNTMFNDVTTKESLFPLISMKFEDININCPKDTHKYLADKYGDYMKIPEKADRITHDPVQIEFDIKGEKY